MRGEWNFSFLLGILYYFYLRTKIAIYVVIFDEMTTDCAMSLTREQVERVYKILFMLWAHMIAFSVFD